MRIRLLAAAGAALAATALGTVAVVAQIDGGDRGVAAIDSSTDFEVSGVIVDTRGADAESARLAGWREAQRKAWAQLTQRLGSGAGMLSDGALDSIVSSIVVDDEEIGPNRYIAKLGVLFDRQRTASLLGIALYDTRSPPMVVIPVQWSTGVGTTFEQRTPWQEAWARYRTSNSEIDYIRPSGTGPDPLLLNVGQTQRPDRAWWRHVLDQYGGDDVLMPTVKLYRQWPGGPVIATFEARHGPDNRLLGSFTLRVSRSSGLPALLDAGVARLDSIYQNALRAGYLRADPGLVFTPPPVAITSEDLGDDLALDDNGNPIADPAAPVTQFSVQVDTPDAGSVGSAEASLRGTAGVRSASTVSLALGGVSVMSVSYAGAPDAFRAALQSRGWQVFGSGSTLRIRRAPQLLPPELQPDNSAAG